MKYLLRVGRVALIGLVALSVFTFSIAYAQLGVVDLSHAEFEKKTSANPNVVIIDVRSAGEFAEGRVPNAINIAHSDILENISLLDEYQDKELIFYCRSGVRAGRVTDFLAESGFTDAQTIYHLGGDMLGWQAADQAIENTSD